MLQNQGQAEAWLRAECRQKRIAQSQQRLAHRADRGRCTPDLGLARVLLPK
jgi:hypothetical protein